MTDPRENAACLSLAAWCAKMGNPLDDPDADGVDAIIARAY